MVCVITFFMSYPAQVIYFKRIASFHIFEFETDVFVLVVSVASKATALDLELCFQVCPFVQDWERKAILVCLWLTG